MGLHLNIAKCEIICTENDMVPPIFAGFSRLLPTECELLGAPLLTGKALDSALAARCADLSRASDRLRSLSAHDALLILTHSVSAPKLNYILRCSPCSGHRGLDEFDHILRVTLSQIANVEIDDLAWTQANLPVGEGVWGFEVWLCLRLLHFLLLQLPHKNFSLTFFRLAGIILIPAETLPWRSGRADITPLPPKVGPRSTRNRGTGHQLLKDRPP